MEMVRVLDRSDKLSRIKCSFDILKGIKNISAVWVVVSVNYLNGVWCEPLPEFMHDFTRSEPKENIVEDISKLT